MRGRAGGATYVRFWANETLIERVPKPVISTQGYRVPPARTIKLRARDRRTRNRIDLFSKLTSISILVKILIWRIREYAGRPMGPWDRTPLRERALSRSAATRGLPAGG